VDYRLLEPNRTYSTQFFAALEDIGKRAEKKAGERFKKARYKNINDIKSEAVEVTKKLADEYALRRDYQPDEHDRERLAIQYVRAYVLVHNFLRSQQGLFVGDVPVLHIDASGAVDERTVHVA
jgi:hypothetical protein